MAVEKTFFMVKPDGVKRGLIGTIISRLENKGLTIKDAAFMQVSENLAKTHYEEHKEKPFFHDLINHITSGPVMAMVVEGENAIQVVRTLMGATNPQEALPGTIRGDYALDITQNLVHGADSKETAAREIQLYFEK